MTPKSVVLAVTLLSGTWLAMVVAGCSGLQAEQKGGDGLWGVTSSGPEVSERQMEQAFTQVAQMYTAAQEALEASRMVGTPDGELEAARQMLAQGEAALYQGQTSRAAHHYQASWQHFRTADRAFRLAEEAAVRAGLSQLERELMVNYGRLLKTGRGSPPLGTVRVSQRNVNLRDGAGADFQVVGKVQLGDTLNLLAEQGEWYCVRAATGVVGWVSKSLVARVPWP